LIASDLEKSRRKSRESFQQRVAALNTDIGAFD